MQAPGITQGRFVPLQPDTPKCFGVVCEVDGGGVRFFLLKDGEDHWGLWEGTNGGLQARLVPLPGPKHHGDPSMVILDGQIIIYYPTRVTDTSGAPTPAHECQVFVPHARRPPSLAHIGAVYAELRTSVAALSAQNTAQAQQIEALRRQMTDLERRFDMLGKTTDPVLLARLEAVEQHGADIVSTLREAGAALGTIG